MYKLALTVVALAFAASGSAAPQQTESDAPDKNSSVQVDVSGGGLLLAEATAKKTKKKKRKRTPPVQFSVMEAQSVSAGGTVELTVDIDVKTGWYIYAPTGRNEPTGMTETVITFDLPEGFELAGDMILPPHHPKGMYEIYDGQDIRMTQPIKVNGAKPGEYTINGKVRYQTCNKDMCLPPTTVELVGKVVVK